MKIYIFIVASLLTASLVYVGRNTYVGLEIGKAIPQATAGWQCSAVRGVQGAEDLLKLDDYTVLATNLDMLPLMKVASRKDSSFTDPSTSVPGHIYALYLSQADGATVRRFEPVKIVGRGENLPAFHPHGFGLTDAKLLRVVSHGYGAGGERVELFHVERGDDNGGDVVLHFRGAVDFADVANGALNDVTSVDENRFYVTQWLGTPDPLRGRDVSARAELVERTLPSLLRLAQTSLYYCDVSESGGSTATVNAERACRIVGTKSIMWNGITRDPSTGLVYALQLMERVIVVFRPSADGELEQVDTIEVPEHYGDNIEFDVPTGMIHMGGVAHLTQCFFKYAEAIAHRAQQDIVNNLPTGGAAPNGELCPSHMTVIDPNTKRVAVAFVHDGTAVGAWASAISNSHGTIFGGSFIDNGIAICKRV
jgi:hypothetical protein